MKRAFKAEIMSPAIYSGFNNYNSIIGNHFDCSIDDLTSFMCTRINEFVFIYYLSQYLFINF